MNPDSNAVEVREEGVHGIVLDEDDIGRLDGDIGPAADGGADVCPGQRRRIVDTVADHPNQLSLILDSLDFLVLVFGKHLREDGVDAQFFGDRVDI